MPCHPVHRTKAQAKGVKVYANDVPYKAGLPAIPGFSSTSLTGTDQSGYARAKYVAETPDRFDVIIVDSTDPMGPGEVLFTETFYKNCRRCLNEGGVLVNQNGVPFMQPDELPMTWKRRRKFFKDTGFYMAAVPSYYGGFMTLGWAATSPKTRDATLATLTKRYAAAKLKTRYYTPAIHKASFALPAFVGKLFG